MITTLRGLAIATPLGALGAWCAFVLPGSSWYPVGIVLMGLALALVLFPVCFGGWLIHVRWPTMVPKTLVLVAPFVLMMIVPPVMDALMMTAMKAAITEKFQFVLQMLPGNGMFGPIS